MNTTRLSVQSSLTVGVLAAGIVLAALGGSAPAHPRRHVAVAAQGGQAAPAPTTSAPPTGSPLTAHAPSSPVSPGDLLASPLLKKLRHPRSESWGKLLPAVPSSATVIQSTSNLPLAAMRKEFKSPDAVDLLKFDGYRRGVLRSYHGSSFGVIEELWQFRQPVGAAAWYIDYCQSNQPGHNPVFAKSFALDRLGSRAFVSNQIDASGYHFAIGTGIKGDIVINLRLFSTSPIRHADLTREMRIAARPVARGLSMVSIFGRAINSRLPHGRSANGRTSNGGITTLGT